MDRIKALSGRCSSQLPWARPVRGNRHGSNSWSFWIIRVLRLTLQMFGAHTHWHTLTIIDSSFLSKKNGTKKGPALWRGLSHIYLSGAYNTWRWQESPPVDTSSTGNCWLHSSAGSLRECRGMPTDIYLCLYSLVLCTIETGSPKRLERIVDINRVWGLKRGICQDIYMNMRMSGCQNVRW